MDFYPVPHTQKKTLKNEAESRLVGAVQHSPSCDEKGEEIHQEVPNIQKLCEGCKVGLWTQHGCILKDGAVELIYTICTNVPEPSSASARSQCTSLLLSRQESKIWNWIEVKWREGKWSTRIWRSWQFFVWGRGKRKRILSLWRAVVNGLWVKPFISLAVGCIQPLQVITVYLCFLPICKWEKFLTRFSRMFSSSQFYVYGFERNKSFCPWTFDCTTLRLLSLRGAQGPKFPLNWDYNSRIMT